MKTSRNRTNARAVRSIMTSTVPCPPGTLVPQAGVYSFHHTCSRPAQEVVVLRGWRLPACRDCISGGGYVLEHAAPGIEEDPDFKAQPTRAASMFAES